jgi:hypothetical protein
MVAVVMVMVMVVVVVVVVVDKVAPGQKHPTASANPLAATTGRLVLT